MYSARYADEILWLVNYLLEIYKKNIKTVEQSRLDLFAKRSKFTDLALKFGVCVYCSSALNYFAYPLYMYVYENKIVTILPALIPGVDEQTLNGFFITLVYHIVLILLGLLGSLASDFMFTMLTINAPIMSHLFEYEVELLNDVLSGKKSELKNAKHVLRNILLMNRERTMLVNYLQKYFFCFNFYLFSNFSYIQTMDKTFFKICFVQLASAVLASCLLLFIIMTVI